MTFCNKCKQGWCMMEDDTWITCICVLEEEFRGKCRRPEIGFDDNMPIPVKDQIIVGSTNAIDYHTNSMVRSYCKRDRRVTVLHIDANSLVEEVFTKHNLDTADHTIMFIIMNRSGSNMGRAMGIGQALEARRLAGLATHLLVMGESRDKMFKRYQGMDNSFVSQLSELELVTLKSSPVSEDQATTNFDAGSLL